MEHKILGVGVQSSFLTDITEVNQQNSQSTEIQACLYGGVDRLICFYFLIVFFHNNYSSQSSFAGISIKGRQIDENRLAFALYITKKIVREER